MIPAHVTFKGLAPRPDIDALVDHELAELGRHYDRIFACRVRIDVPHRRHASGNAVQVLIELTVPQDRLVVEHDAGPYRNPVDGAGDGTLIAAVREAFAAARTQLARYAGLQRHEPRHRAAASRP